MEALLTAISKNGPVSYERNETRLWVTPFVNRSRTNRTSSDIGNQGWSGGSLIGLEQRDKKNTWSLGLLTGLMGSRSHVLGAPDTFSKTKGFLIGAFNTYKYTKQWGHESLVSRTSTLIDSQRYGLDKQDKQTPFYALSNYKSTTDLANTQINYLFNIIKKKVTCRLNTGVTYSRSQSGNITERNAGENGLNTIGNARKSAEFYNGIGIRRIWANDTETLKPQLEQAVQVFRKGEWESGWMICDSRNPHSLRIRIERDGKVFQLANQRWEIDLRPEPLAVPTSPSKAGVGATELDTSSEDLQMASNRVEMLATDAERDSFF